MSISIPVTERRVRLARRHHLGPGLRTDDLALLADDLVALHSTDPVTVYLSAMVRMVTPSVEAVEKALYDDRVVVRHHAMRRTLWVATPDTARRMHAAATVKVARAEHLRLVGILEENGVDDGERWLADAKRQVLAVLHADGPTTARELGLRVPSLTRPLEVGQGTRWAVTLAAHTRVLLGLGFDGVLVRTRPTGTWVNGQYRWAAMDDWLPGGVDGFDEREAARDLADHWLRRFGPGTTSDLQWWMGWTLRLTRTALADCGAVEVDLDGEPGWVAADDTAPDEPVEPWVALLPSLDPTTMGWKERGWYLPQEAADAFDRNGNAGPTIWVDGRVVGAWAQRPDGEIRTHYFVPVAAGRRDEVRQRAEDLRAWLGETRVSVRFPGRVNAGLMA